MTKNNVWRIMTGALASVMVAPGVLAQDDISASTPEKKLFYGLSLEQFEYRFGDDADILAWDGDGFFGTDAWRLRLQSEGEYVKGEDVFETLENQVLIQHPISYYFDAKAGVRFDTPEGPDRTHAVIGVQGLAPQWFEVDADLFISEDADISARLDVDYELLVTNRIILTPTAEINIAFSDDEEIGIGSGLSDIELGLRLSYDLIERDVVPYIGVHYEKKFGQTADFARDEGEDDEEVFFVAGVRFLF